MDDQTKLSSIEKSKQEINTILRKAEQASEKLRATQVKDEHEEEKADEVPIQLTQLDKDQEKKIRLNIKEENKVNDFNNIIEETEESERDLIDNENIATLEAIYEKSQQNLEKVLEKRLNTNSTDGFGNYITITENSNTSPNKSPGKRKSAISYKSKDQTISPRKLSYQQLSPKMRLKDSDPSAPLTNTSQFVSLNLSLHKSKNSKVSFKEINLKGFHEENQENNENEEGMDKWEHRKSIAKTERSKVKYNKINFNRGDKIFPSTPKTVAQIGFNREQNIVVSPIMKAKIGVSLNNLNTLDGNDGEVDVLSHSVKLNRSQTQNFQRRLTEVSSTFGLGFGRKSSFITNPGNKGEIYNKNANVITEGPWEEKKSIFNICNRNSRYSYTLTKSTKIEVKKSKDFIKIQPLNTEDKNSISNELEESSELKSSHRKRAKTTFNTFDFKKRKSKLDLGNDRLDSPDSKLDYKLTGFEKEGYKRKCSLNSEIMNRAIANSNKHPSSNEDSSQLKNAGLNSVTSVPLNAESIFKSNDKSIEDVTDLNRIKERRIQMKEEKLSPKIIKQFPETIYEKNVKWKKDIVDKSYRKRTDLLREEMKECSFSPNSRIIRNRNTISKKESEEFYKDKILWKSTIDLKNRELKLMSERKLYEECSFRPQTRSKSARNIVNEDPDQKKVDYVYRKNMRWLKNVEENRRALELDLEEKRVNQNKQPKSKLYVAMQNPSKEMKTLFDGLRPSQNDFDYENLGNDLALTPRNQLNESENPSQMSENARKAVAASVKKRSVLYISGKKFKKNLPKELRNQEKKIDEMKKLFQSLEEMMLLNKKVMTETDFGKMNLKKGSPILKKSPKKKEKESEEIKIQDVADSYIDTLFYKSEKGFNRQSLHSLPQPVTERKSKVSMDYREKYFLINEKYNQLYGPKEVEEGPSQTLSKSGRNMSDKNVNVSEREHISVEEHVSIHVEGAKSSESRSHYDQKSRYSEAESKAISKKNLTNVNPYSTDENLSREVSNDFTTKNLQSSYKVQSVSKKDLPTELSSEIIHTNPNTKTNAKSNKTLKSVSKKTLPEQQVDVKQTKEKSGKKVFQINIDDLKKPSNIKASNSNKVLTKQAQDGGVSNKSLKRVEFQHQESKKR